MSIGPLKRRSSWPSSFVTGLIGWNGFFIILAVILGDMSAGNAFILATLAAIAQVLVLRLLFFVIRMDRSMLTGGFWGGVTGIIIALIEMRMTNLFDAHPIIWLLNALYIGVAVGLFLNYFHRDDRRIEREAVVTVSQLTMAEMLTGWSLFSSEPSRILLPFCQAHLIWP